MGMSSRESMNQQMTETVKSINEIKKKPDTEFNVRVEIPTSGGPQQESIGINSYNEVAEEPILQEPDNKYTLFPIKHHDVWEMYKHAVFFLDSRGSRFVP